MTSHVLHNTLEDSAVSYKTALVIVTHQYLVIRYLIKIEISYFLYSSCKTGKLNEYNPRIEVLSYLTEVVKSSGVLTLCSCVNSVWQRCLHLLTQRHSVTSHKTWIRTSAHTSTVATRAIECIAAMIIQKWYLPWQSLRSNSLRPIPMSFLVTYIGFRGREVRFINHAFMIQSTVTCLCA